MQALDRWAYAKEDPVFRTAIECLEGYDAELRVIRKALASRVPAELAAALVSSYSEAEGPAMISRFPEFSAPILQICHLSL